MEVVLDKVRATWVEIMALLGEVMVVVTWVMVEEDLVLVEEITTVLLEETVMEVVGVMAVLVEEVTTALLEGTVMAAVGVMAGTMGETVILEAKLLIVAVVMGTMVWLVAEVVVTAFLVLEMAEMKGLGLVVVAVKATILARLLVVDLLRTIQWKGVSGMMMRITMMILPKEPKK